MRFRSLSSVVAILMALVVGVATAQATVWNAVTQFSATSNTASDTWQYLYIDSPTPGVNDGYTLFPSYETLPTGYGGWKRPDIAWQFVTVNPSYSDVLTVHPNVASTDEGGLSYRMSAVGWKSPVSEAVNVEFSVAHLWPAGGDAVDYWLFKQGDTTALASGSIGLGGHSGPVAVSNVSVSTGDMLYLQVGPKGSADYDLTGVTFVVSTVPEPSSTVLLLCMAIGLVAYAWRRRK